MDIREDIKCYQDTLSYASSKVDYSVGENIYMLPSDMNLKIRSGTVVFNNNASVNSKHQHPPRATPGDFPQLSARVPGFVPSEFLGGPLGVEPVT